MAEPKRRDKPKGSELRASLKPKKPVRPTVKAMEDALTAGAAGSLLGAAASEATDPYLSRNEFKPGFYEQNAGKITPEGLYGTASGKKMFEADIVDPDTSMMQNMTKGGQAKVAKVMREFKKGKLHSGDKKGPVVKNPKQAIAIALSEAGMSKPQKKQEGGLIRFKKQYQMHNGKF